MLSYCKPVQQVSTHSKCSNKYSVPLLHSWYQTLSLLVCFVLFTIGRISYEMYRDVFHLTWTSTQHSARYKCPDPLFPQPAATQFGTTRPISTLQFLLQLQATVPCPVWLWLPQTDKYKDMFPNYTHKATTEQNTFL